MADQDFLHTVELMKAALPYIDSRTRVMAELFTKIMDLMSSLKVINGSNQLAVCGYENKNMDMEGLLTGIRPLCNNREREIVDRILSIFNMKRMFEMYNNIMSAMKTMQEFGGGFPFGDSGSKDDTDNVTGNFSGMNFESIFQSFANSTSNETTDSPTAASFEADLNSQQNETPEPEVTSSYNSNNEQISNAGSSGNNRMLDMLKAMVPPEQISTFENLSMLLNTMSYDNNSKPGNSKENKDG